MDRFNYTKWSNYDMYIFQYIIYYTCYVNSKYSVDIQKTLVDKKLNVQVFVADTCSMKLTLGSHTCEGRS